jgi:hypothetical protein
MELPTRTVYRILQIYRDFGTITDPWAGKQGRRCELDPRLIRVSTIIILIIQYLTGVLLVVKKDWYLAELRKELVEAGAGEISIATTWRYLDRANITHKKVYKVDDIIHCSFQKWLKKEMKLNAETSRPILRNMKSG